MAARKKRGITEQQYDEALLLYRAHIPSDEICEAVGITLDQYDQLVHDGLPKANPPKPSFTSALLRELAVFRAGAHAWMSTITSAALESAKIRAKSVLTAAEIEMVMLNAWKAETFRELKAAKKEERPVDLAALIPPPAFVASLRTLARVQDLTAVIRGPAQLYRGVLEHDEDEEGEEDTGLDRSIFRDLKDLDEDELEEYARTGKVPKKPKSDKQLPLFAGKKPATEEPEDPADPAPPLSHPAEL